MYLQIKKQILYYNKKIMRIHFGVACFCVVMKQEVEAVNLKEFSDGLTQTDSNAEAVIDSNVHSSSQT